MPQKRNTLYTLDEVEEIVDTYVSLAYDTITMDTMSEKDKAKVKYGAIRSILNGSIQRVRNLPLKVRQKFWRRYSENDLEKKCKSFLMESKFK